MSKNSIQFLMAADFQDVYAIDDTRRKLTLILAVALLLLIQGAFAATVTITAKGTVISGYDDARTDMAGHPFTLVLVFDDTQGQQKFLGEGFSEIASTAASFVGSGSLNIEGAAQVYAFQGDSESMIGRNVLGDYYRLTFRVGGVSGFISVPVIGKPNPDWRVSFAAITPFNGLVRPSIAQANVGGASVELQFTSVYEEGLTGLNGSGGSSDCPAVPTKGDILIYRTSSAGMPLHSAVISRISCKKAEDGSSQVEVIFVISKWGDKGLYEHDPNNVPSSYGNWVAYHTDRGSNLLRTIVKNGITHYVTDMTHTTVELNYIDQTIRDIRTSLTVHEAETSIDGDGWWENPTAKTVQEGGIPLYSQLIPKADPSFRYDCHGYTFASGRVWINDDIVDLILSENGYNTFPSQDTRGKTHQ